MAGKKAQAIADKVLNKATGKPNNSGADGAIVLQHDGPNILQAAETVAALDILILQMMNWGYEFVTLSEHYSSKDLAPVWWTIMYVQEPTAGLGLIPEWDRDLIHRTWDCTI